MSTEGEPGRDAGNVCRCLWLSWCVCVYVTGVQWVEDAAKHFTVHTTVPQNDLSPNVKSVQAENPRGECPEEIAQGKAGQAQSRKVVSDGADV